MRSHPSALVLVASVVLASSAMASTDVSHAAVVVVRGSADHMEQVLKRAHVEFVAVNPEELPGLALNAHQVLMVNCTGDMPKDARERVRRFVAAGGFLYTTDHAVHELIEPIFPNTIAWTGRETTEGVYPVTVRVSEKDRGLLSSLGGNSREYWQTAGGGYPFRVLDAHRVTVLMESDAVAKKFGAGAIAVRFPYQDGQVIHVTGHFFTQPGQQPEAVASAGRGFEQFSSNVVQEKARDGARVEALYDASAKTAAPLRSGPGLAAAPASTVGTAAGGVSAGEHLKILERKDRFTHVRDEQGNEGWVPTDAL